jgi:hypothetical protein
MEHAAMEGPALLVWLESGWIGAAMRKSPMLYPAVETLHIIGFSILVGSIIVFDLRVLGLGRFLPIERAAQHMLPVALCGFALAVPMGFLLFATEATSIAGNPSFLMKMSLLVVAGLNALLFHLIPSPGAALRCGVPMTRRRPRSWGRPCRSWCGSASSAAAG